MQSQKYDSQIYNNIILSKKHSEDKIVLFEPPLLDSEKVELKIPLPIAQINQESNIKKLNKMKKKNEMNKKKKIINKIKENKGNESFTLINNQQYQSSNTK